MPPSSPLHILMALLSCPFFVLVRATAAATYPLSPYMTISNLSLAGNTSTPSLPLLLDTLSACSWVPATGFAINGTPQAADGDKRIDRTACSHYLGGWVAGTLRTTNVTFGGAEIDGVKVLSAEGFSAMGNRTFEEWREYYGGAAGVLGLGLYEGVYEVGDGGRVSPTGDIMLGVLRDLWIGEKEEGRERSWSVALPRGQEEGAFVVGGFIQVGGDVRTTGQAFVLPMEVGLGWDGEALLQTMPYALPSVGFDVGGDDFVLKEAHGKGEAYFLDSALPVIYTSQEMAENVSKLFSPAGRYDSASMVYMVDCNATAPGGISLVFDDGHGGNRSIAIYPGDLIMPMPLAPGGKETCMSAFQVSPDHPEMRRLGWPFFRNAVVTVDVGRWTVNLTARAWPEGGTSSRSMTQPTSNLVPGTPTMSSFSRSEHSSTDTMSSSSSTSSDSTPPLPTATAMASAAKSDPLGISFTTTEPDADATSNRSSSSQWQPGSVSPDPMGNAPETWPALPPSSSAASSTPPASMTAPVRRKVDGEAQLMADEQSGSSKGKEGGDRATGRWWPVKWKITRSLGLGGVDEGLLDEKWPASECVQHDSEKGPSNVRRGKKVKKREL